MKASKTEIDFSDFLREKFPDGRLDKVLPIIADGLMHKFPVSSNDNKNSGWYTASYYNNVICAIGGDWHQPDDRFTWQSSNYKRLSNTEKKVFRQKMKAISLEADKEREKLQKEAASKAVYILSQAKLLSVSDNFPYLIKKGVKPCNELRLNHYKEKLSLLVPVYWGIGKDKKIVSFQSIGTDGEKRFLKSAQKGYFLINGNKEKPLCFVEGLATGISVFEATGYSVVIAFDAGSIDRVVGLFRSNLPDRQFIICADDDHEKPKNAGMTAANNAAAKHNCIIAKPIFLDGVGKSDFNDMHCEQGLEAVKLCIDSAVSEYLKGREERQKHLNGVFVVNRDGVFWEQIEKDDDGQDKIKRVWLCSPLRILADTRDDNGLNWGRWCRWTDASGQIHLRGIPARLLKGGGEELREILLDGGAKLGAERKARSYLNDFFQLWKTDKLVTCTSKSGWYDEKNVYVLPDETIGQTSDSEEIVFQSDTLVPNGWSSRGTLAEWKQKIANRITGHSKLVFALCTAFAAPLLKMSGLESRGFHFLGGSSTGKTTALQVASSLYGKAENYTKSWRTTGNGLEGLAMQHNDGLLCLDEFSQIDADEVANGVVYLLANGKGKTRAFKDGTARQAASWRLLLLSNGEESLASKMESARRSSINVGEELRFIHINVDGQFGILDDAVSKDEAALFSDSLKSAANQYYGVAGKEWIKTIIANNSDIKATVRESISLMASSEGYLPVGASGQIGRVLKTFSLIAAAGEIATAYGFTDWEDGTAEKSVMAIFNRWVKDFGIGNKEEEKFLESVASKMFQEDNHFSNLHGLSRKDVQNPIWGYYSHAGNADEPTYIDASSAENSKRLYLLRTAEYKKLICCGRSIKWVNQVLKKHGFLIPESDSVMATAIRPNGMFNGGVVKALVNRARFYVLDYGVMQAYGSDIEE